MIIDQLSANGYTVSDIFDNTTLDTLIELTDSFDPDRIRPNVRHVKFLKDQKIANLLDTSFKHLVGDTHVGIIELWRDYPEYTNLYHIDDSIMSHVLVVYLDGEDQIDMGTGYIEDKEYKVNYKKNTGLLLLNSDKIQHGMIGKVHDVKYRKVLYANWLPNKSPSR